MSGGVRGTLPWMAPELLSGKSNMVTEKVMMAQFHYNNHPPTTTKKKKRKDQLIIEGDKIIAITDRDVSFVFLWQIDVYSFGIVMWELLTGDEPYTDMHCASIIGII